jgi:hypothetical protein
MRWMTRRGVSARPCAEEVHRVGRRPRGESGGRNNEANIARYDIWYQFTPETWVQHALADEASTICLALCGGGARAVAFGRWSGVRGGGGGGGEGREGGSGGGGDGGGEGSGGCKRRDRWGWQHRVERGSSGSEAINIPEVDGEDASSSAVISMPRRTSELSSHDFCV